MCGQEDTRSICKKSCHLCPEVIQTAACFDSNPQCSSYKTLNMCGNPSIANQCMKSCGGCGCRDYLDTCHLLVKTMQCTSTFLATLCPRSCQSCPSTPVTQGKRRSRCLMNFILHSWNRVSGIECFDKIANCELIKSMGKCTDGVMGQRMCRRTCNVCGLRSEWHS